MINLFMIIIGMLMDDTSDVLRCTRILLPIVIDLGVENVTPTTAPFLYFGGQLAKVPINEVI